MENIIIQSTAYKYKKPLIIGVIAIPLIMIIMGVILYINNFDMCRVVTRYDYYTGRIELLASYSIFENILYPFSFVPGLLIDFAILLMVVGGFFIFAFASCTLTVTDKRVYGKASFRRRVDLPIDSVSSVGTSMFHGIDIGTSSGRISFKAIENNIQLHEVISKLLIDRQKEKNTEVSPSTPTGSIADELKKFKELLDAGIITQEEFDAKKKQLLGL